MDSPQNGTIIIVPQFKDRTVKIIIADDESQGDMLIPILEDVPEGEHYGYGRAATEIQEKTDIVYAARKMRRSGTEPFLRFAVSCLGHHWLSFPLGLFLFLPPFRTVGIVSTPVLILVEHTTWMQLFTVLVLPTLVV